MAFACFPEASKFWLGTVLRVALTWHAADSQHWHLVATAVRYMYQVRDADGAGRRLQPVTPRMRGARWCCTIVVGRLLLPSYMLLSLE